jgi:hypothetical protein
MKAAFVIKDTTILKAVLDFSKALGLSVDDDNYEREAGEAIAIGTSKKYTVSGNERASFYSEKKGLELLYLDTNVAVFVTTLLTHYTSGTTPVKSVETLDLYLEADNDWDKDYDSDAIYLLVSKVKKQDKNPADYYVIDTTGDREYTLTTDSDDEDSVGNLAEIFASL